MHAKGIWILILCLGMPIFLFPCAVSAEPLDNWFQRTSGSTPAKARFINNQFVAVTTDGSIFTSIDGFSWQVTSNIGDATGVTVSDISYANGTYIIVGARNVAGSDRPLIKTSQDLQTWADRAVNIGEIGRIMGIAYGNEVFVAVGYGSAGSFSTTSSDGLAWNQAVMQLGQLNALAFGNIPFSELGVFVAVGAGGRIIRSVDGINWSNQFSSVSSSLNDIVYANNMFIAAGNSGSIVTSSTGISWTVVANQSTFGGTDIILPGVAYGNGSFMVVGYSGTSTYPTVVGTSTDGFSWSFQECDMPQGQLKSVAYGNDVFVVSHVSGRILTSPDGVSWDNKHLSYLEVALNAAYYANGRFVAGGQSGTSSYLPCIMTSVDGSA